MGGATALVNKGVAKDKSIQLFYNTDRLNLAVVLKSGDPEVEDPDKTFSAKDTDQTGIIFKPSDIASFVYQGINIVVGVTYLPSVTGEPAPTNYNISIVSPIYRPLTTTEFGQYNTHVAAAVGGSAAYVYYLSSTNENDTTIKEYQVNTSTASTLTGTTKIRRGTSLAAYYSGDGHRHIIYQSGEDNTLYDFSPDANNVHIANSSDARVGTSLAVVYANEKVSLYYADGNNQIHRIIAEKDVWGPSHIVEGSKADKDSQFTVANANGANHLFYRQPGESTFTHKIDIVKTA